MSAPDASSFYHWFLSVHSLHLRRALCEVWSTAEHGFSDTILFFGYTGCLLLSSGFPYLWQAWAPLVIARGLLIVVASLVAEHRL